MTAVKESAAYIHARAELELNLALWQPRLGLDHWRIGFSFLDACRDPDDATDLTPAQCDAQWSALRADIKIWLPSIAGYTDTALEELVVHELAHVLLAPEQETLEVAQAGQMELATEMVARALLAAWPCWASKPKKSKRRSKPKEKDR